MKKAFILVAAIITSLPMISNNVQLIVEQVNNQGAVSGNTYRVYAQMPDAQHSLHIVFGTSAHPLQIETTAPLYQHPFGGYSPIQINETTVQAAPALKYDSYITLGYENGDGNSMWDLGINFDAFNAGGGLSTADGGWFLLPTDAKCESLENNLILIAQFTTTGVVSGTLNLQGWSAPQQAWQEFDLTFSTSNAQVFGCTDANATNYQQEATFDNATCEYAAASTHHQAEGHEVTQKQDEKEQSWSIFPNPLKGDLVHVQFKNAIAEQTQQVQVDILDAAGKKVGAHTIARDAVEGGNRISLKQTLAAGVYHVVLTMSGKTETQTLVVE